MNDLWLGVPPGSGARDTFPHGTPQRRRIYEAITGEETNMAEHHEHSKPVCRAKFRINSVTKHGWTHKGHTQSVSIQASPVHSQDPNSENGRFWKASPIGELKLQIDNPAAFGVFEQGATFYVDFTPAPDEVPA